MSSTRKALVILSGGQDSTTALFVAREAGFDVSAITFNYGQRHSIELDAAKRVAFLAGVEDHEIVDVPNILRSSSPLTDPAAKLEQYENFEQMDKVIGNRVELTFVPMRNAFFFTVGMNRAVAKGCDLVYTGICQEDNANYPDCREEFRDVFQRMVNVSLGVPNYSIELRAPLMHLTKAETVALAHSIGRDAIGALAFSHTSYDGQYPPTDMNHSNVLRAQGFLEADRPDPLVVRAWMDGLMKLPNTRNYSDPIWIDHAAAAIGWARGMLVNGGFA